MEFRLNLIDGTFTAKEATEIIRNLLEFKISYHSRESFSNEIRNGEKHEASLKRIEQLMQTKKDFLDKVKEYGDGEALKLYSEIVISESKNEQPPA
ncbi:MAG TPA: hypothetical protein VFR70_08630 [Flavobacterium sp.]|nr:hypothetical protein [Flavobacterium sp.]